MTDITPIKSPPPASGKGKHARKRVWKYIIVAMGLVVAAGYLALCFLVVYAGGAAGCCGGHGSSSSDIGPREFLLSGGMLIKTLIDYKVTDERERAADAPWQKEFEKQQAAIHQALVQDDLPAMKQALSACLDFFDRYEKARPKTEGILHLHDTGTNGGDYVSSSMCRVRSLEVGGNDDFILSSALKNNASRILDDYLTESEQKALAEAKANGKTDDPYAWRPDLPSELRCAEGLVDPHDIPGLFSDIGASQPGESSARLNSPAPAVLETLHVLSRHRKTPGRAGEATLQGIFLSALEDQRLDVASVIFKEVDGKFNYCQDDLETTGEKVVGFDVRILQAFGDSLSDYPPGKIAAEKMAFSLFSAWPKARWDFLADFYLDLGAFAIDSERDCLNYTSGPYREAAQRIAATRPGTHWESIPHEKPGDRACPPDH